MSLYIAIQFCQGVLLHLKTLPRLLGVHWRRREGGCSDGVARGSDDLMHFNGYNNDNEPVHNRTFSSESTTIDRTSQHIQV